MFPDTGPMTLEQQLSVLGTPYLSGASGTPAPQSGGGGLFSSLFSQGSDATNGGFGWNIGTGRLAMSGLGALGNLWSSFQAQDLAKKQFGLTRDVMNTNLANQIKSYNTRLSDIARARGVTEGQSQAQVDDYVTRNQLSR